MCQACWGLWLSQLPSGLEGAKKLVPVSRKVKDCRQLEVGAVVLGVPGCVPNKLNCCPIIDFWLCCAAAEAGISLLNAWNHVHVMEMYPKLFSVTLSFIDTGHSAARACSYSKKHPWQVQR